MASSTEQLIFEILAKDADASAAFDRFRRKVDDTSKSVDGNSKALDNNSKSVDKNKESQRSWLGALAGAGVAFAPIISGAAAAGIGVTAFTALAVPSAKKISTALTGPDGLAGSWVTLDNRQRNAALSIQALGQDYETLAKQMEPQVFQVFNQGLNITNGLLQPTGQLARTSGQGISDFLATFDQSSGLQHFISFLSSVARPAIGLLGSDVTQTAHAVFSLLESFGGTGLLELRALSGAFTALDDSVSFLSQHAPGLTSAGLAIGGIALSLSKLGLLSGALKITGISNIAGQLTGFTEATKGATLAEKGMLGVNTALEAISPWAWVAAGVLALGGLVYAVATYKGSIDTVISEQARQDQATGFNISGWNHLADSLGAASKNYTYIANNFKLGRGNIGGVTDEVDQLTAAQQRYEQNSATLVSFLATVGDKYGLTQEQAIRLAEASGVLVDKQGKLTEGFSASVSKADAFANANLAARSPVTQLTKDLQDFSNQTLTATQRQTALTNALKLFFDPAVAADQDLVTLKTDQQALAAALQASAGKTAGLAGAQGTARQAFDTYIGQVATAASDAFNATGKTSSYTKIINDSLPFLLKAAGANKTLRQEIQNLINTEKGLTPEHVSITVGATGTWNVVQGNGGPPQLRAPGAALGMFVSGGRPGVDDQLIRAQRGELIVPTRIVDSGAVDHLRGQIPGFAAGGVVGSYQGQPPGLGRFLTVEDNATLVALERSVAAATLAGIRAAMTAHPVIPGGGSSGVAVGLVQQWAKTHLSDFGWGPSQFPPLQALWNQESGWRWNATNPSSGAYGIPQSLPADKMASAGPDWRTNPVTQMRWGLEYIRSAYGSPSAAEGHELAFNWYDQGGWLPPGISIAANGTGRPERVGGGDTIIHLTVNVGHGTNPRQAAKEIADILNQGAVAGVRLRKSILSANG